MIWALTSAASTVMHSVDNCTMISLVRAPQIPVKSRHIEQQHRYACLLHELKIIDLVHVPAPVMRAPPLTAIYIGKCQTYIVDL